MFLTTIPRPNVGMNPLPRPVVLYTCIVTNIAHPQSPTALYSACRPVTSNRQTRPPRLGPSLSWAPFPFRPRLHRFRWWSQLHCCLRHHW